MPFDFSGMAPPEQELSTLDKLVDRAKKGDIVPIVSQSLTGNLAFRDYGALIAQWAKETKYPHDGHTLAQIAQYETINKTEDGHSIDELKTKERYLEFLVRALFHIANNEDTVSASRREELKSQGHGVSELAWHLDLPSLKPGQENPLLLLANLPLPVYLTTSYHKFLQAALEKVGKTPRTDFCRWHEGLFGIPSVFDQEACDPETDRSQVYHPTKDCPLVYHLHGLDEYPTSLVLTEDDHLDFLTNISINDTRIIHPAITQKLTQSTLVMLGYGLSSWEFRVLFRGVIKPRPQPIEVRNVAIQLEDSLFEKEYVKKYLQRARFDVQWTDAHAFIKQIYQRVEEGA